MDKLKHNKILFALLFFFLSSCSDLKAYPPIHTEVLCYEAGLKILIRNIASADFWQAVEAFDKIRKARNSNENYVVLVFKNNYSMQIKNIKSEEMLQGCVARDVNWQNISDDYIIY